MLRPAGWIVALALVLGASRARAQAADARLVTVHMEAPSGTELKGRATERDHWSVVCTAPCDRGLDPTWLYLVEGSGSVALGGTPAGGTARIVVTPPPSRTPGHTAIVAGGITYVAGEGMTVAWIVGLILHATGQPQQPWVTPLGVAGTAVSVTGVAILVAGALYNRATRDAGHVDVTWAPPPPPPVASPEPEPRPVVPAPAFVLVPLVGGSL